MRSGAAQFFGGAWSKIRNLRAPQRVYIIPTWYCLLFNALLFFVFGYGFWTHSVIVFSAAILVVFIELLSMIEAHVNLRDMNLEIHRGAATEAGGTLTFWVRAMSRSQSFGVQLYPLPVWSKADLSSTADVARKKTPIRPWPKYMRHEMLQALRFWRSSADATTLGEPNEVTVKTLTANAQILPVLLQAQRRGIYPMPDVLGVSMFPFGFFRVLRPFKLSGHLVVYPRQSGAGYHAHNGLRDQQERSAESRDALRGSTDQALKQTHGTKNAATEYREHRPFAAGDSLQRIDWKVSSRRRRKMVKVFVGGPASEQRVLRWDDTAKADPELRLEQLCLWVHEAHREHVPFALELPGVQTAFATSEAHTQHCLRLLAGYDPHGAAAQVAS